MSTYSDKLFLKNDKDLEEIIDPIFESTSNPVLSLVLLYGVPYEIHAGKVVFKLIEEKIYDQDMVDLIYALYCEGSRTNGKQRLQMFYDIQAVLPVPKHPFTYYLTHHVKPKGQLKIASGLLDGITDNFVGYFIGSGGDDYSMAGRSYTAIQSLGLTGTCHLYDKQERNQVVKLGNVTYHYHREYFNYDGDPIPDATFVYDDAYSEEVYDPPDDDCEYLAPVIDKTSQFVVLQQGRKKRIKLVREHKDEKNALGGGTLIYHEGRITVQSTSNTHGPYNAKAIRRNFPNWVVHTSYRLVTKGQLEKLSRVFPNAALIVKNLPTEYEKTPDKAQRFYHGMETRDYIKCTMPAHMECDMCSSVRYHANRLRIPEHKIYYYYAMVNGDVCVSLPLKKKTFLNGLIVTCAKNQCTFEKTLVFCAAKGFATEMVVTAIKALKKMGTIVMHHSGSDFLTLKGADPFPMQFVYKIDVLSLLIDRCGVTTVYGDYVYNENKDGISCYYGTAYVNETISVCSSMAAWVYSAYAKTHDYCDFFNLPVFIRKGSGIDISHLETCVLQSAKQWSVVPRYDNS